MQIYFHEPWQLLLKWVMENMLHFLPWHFLLYKDGGNFLFETIGYSSSILFFIFYLSWQIYLFAIAILFKVWQNLAFIIHSQKWASLFTVISPTSKVGRQGQSCYRWKNLEAGITIFQYLKILIELLILSIMPRHRMIESCGVPLAISPILRHKFSKGWLFVFQQLGGCVIF